MEILIVMGLVAIVGGMTAVIGLDGLQGYLYRSDESQVLTALQHARAQAMGNVCLGPACSDGMPHGVAVMPNDHPNAVVVFQGASYATRDSSLDAIIDLHPTTTHSGIGEVVFAQLSGNVTAPGTITLSDPTGRSSSVVVGAWGQLF